MKQRNASLLKRLQWRAECAAFLAVERLLNLVPLPTLWSAGADISGLARLFASRWPTVRNNLRTVLGPDATEEEIADLTREVFRHTAANLLTALKSAHVPPDQVRDSLEIVNSEAGERAFAKGRGLILISAHMGNWEFLAQAMGAFRPDVRISNLYRPLNNIYLDKVIRERRERLGMKMFAKLTSFHAPIKFVKAQGIFTVLADQRAGRFGVLTPFFGRLMSMSPLPAFIHKHTNAPVLGVSMRTTSPGKWTVTMHDPGLPDDQPFTTAHLPALLESVIRDSVVDEFWMQDLWRLNPKRPLEIRASSGPVRLARDRDKPLYPFSVLVRVPDQCAAFADTLPALTALAASRPDLSLHLLAREQVRCAATSSAIPHTFHSIEADRLPADLQIAIALTDHELSARELAHLYEGPIYALPKVVQSGSQWIPLASDPSLPAPDRWLAALHSLGMHDPPLVWEFI